MFSAPAWLVPQAQAVQQLVEPRVGAQRVPHRVLLEHHKRRVVVRGCAKALERAIVISESGMDCSDRAVIHPPLRRQFR